MNIRTLPADFVDD